MNPLATHLFHEELYRIPAQVTIVVSRPWHKILEDEKILLTKILGSVRISMDGVAIIFREQVSMETIKHLNPGKVLIFGVPVAPEVKPYECARFSDHDLIRADDLNQLDDVRKKDLWLALKQMFRV